MNDPRCEMMTGPDGQCLAQSSGALILHDGRTVPLCDDDKRALDDQRMTFAPEWMAWQPSHVTEAIDRRLIAMREGRFG